MNYKESAIDILSEIIGDMYFSVSVKGYTNMGGGKHVLTVCDMYYAQPGFSVIIGGKKYKITEIIPAVHPDCSIGTMDVMKVEGDASNITANVFDLYKPKFFYGTPIQQGVELGKKEELGGTDYTPMFWLNWGTLRNKFYHNETENKDRDMTIEFYALTQSDNDAWVTDQFKKNAVDPMERMMQLFFNKVQAMSWRFDEYSLNEEYSYLPRFGVYLTNKGMEKSLWSNRLSGVKVVATIPVFRKEYCACPES